MKGPRTNQLVAPTSFITSISRRRAKIDSRIVFAMSSVDALTSRMIATRKTIEITSATVRTRFVVLSPHPTSFTPGQRLAVGPFTWRWMSRPSVGASLAFFSFTTYESGSGFDGTFAYSCGSFFDSSLNAASLETNVTLFTRESALSRRPTCASCDCGG